MGSRSKFSRESSSWLRSFFSFTIASLHHKWNGIRILLPGTECTSHLRSCQVSWNLGS